MTKIPPISSTTANAVRKIFRLMGTRLPNRLSMPSEKAISVAIGMAIVSRSAATFGYCSQECCDQIICLLQSFGLPVTTEYTAQDLYTFTLSDKKRSGGSVRLIVPKEIGFCEILPTPIEELKTFIQAGLSYGSYYSSR